MVMEVTEASVTVSIGLSGLSRKRPEEPHNSSYGGLNNCYDKPRRVPNNCPDYLPTCNGSASESEKFVHDFSEDI